MIFHMWTFIHFSWTVVFISKRIHSTVVRVEFIMDGISLVMLWDRWCNITVVNVHVPVEDKSNYIKYNSYEKTEHTVYQFHTYYIKIMLQNLYINVGTRIFISQQLR
jgi:hypothetical protein